MRDIIREIILISLLICGTKIAYNDGKILGFIGSRLWKMYEGRKILYYMSMPLGTCVYCMASIYGLVFHWFFGLIGEGVAIQLLPFVIVGLIPVNGIIYGLCKKLDSSLE